jgi:F-type H+-transporting ATPase subunit b
MQSHVFLIDAWTHGVFWVLVAVVIFAILAGRRIVNAVVGMLDARTKKVQDALDEAAQLKAEAEAMLRDAQAAQVQAAKDAEQILASAAAEAARMAAHLAAEAEATAKRRERMAMDRITAAEAAAVKEVRAAAIDIATAASTRLLHDTFGAAADAAMIEQSIAGVPAALRQII